jgi:hypothetical protein
VDHVPKQARKVQSMQMMQSADRVAHRQLTLMPDSPVTRVKVMDTNGVDIATIYNGERNVTFRGRGDISAIVFSIDGVSRSCDLTGLDWLDNSTHIGMSTAMQNGEPVCTLEDLTESFITQDIFAQMPGGRCVYMSDQRGRSGMVCE